MEGLSFDLRFAFRLMRKAPVLSIATIVTLALGIGLNAGVFTVLSGLMLRPRVTADPGSFIHLRPEYSGTRVPIHESPALTTADYVALRSRATTVRALAAWVPRTFRVGQNDAVRDLGMLVSCNFFDVYGLDHMERGRAFRESECAQPGVPAAIISDQFWRRRFNADPDILQKPLIVNGDPYTIVGVTPPDFPGRVRGLGLWVPYTMEPRTARDRGSALNDTNVAWLWVDGRLAAGVSADAAESELNVLLRQQDSLVPGRVSAVSLNNGALIHEPAARPIAMLILPLVLGAVGLVLLIAAGNVTLLLLSRAVARQREIAVRLAIGCSRARLVRMLLTESVLLAAIGMPLSAWLAAAAPSIMRRMVPQIPFFPLEPDGAVFSYLTAASLTAGVAAGLAPALESLRQRLTPMLAGQGAFAGSGRSRIRDVLIAAQVGMSFVLLAGTGLFLRAERAIALHDPSVDAAHVMLATYDPPRGTSAALMPAMTNRLARLPGVRSIAYLAGSGDVGAGSLPWLVVDGRPIETHRRVPISVVSASYFDTMKRPLLQGRGFTDAGAATASVRPIVISDSLAAVWWPHASALGAQLVADDGRRFEVTGVVHPDVAFVGGTADTIQAFTLAPAAPPAGTFLLRFDGDAATLQSSVRDLLREMTPAAATVPITLAAADADEASKFMPLVEMVGSLGVTAIILALVGIYGVVSFAIGRRTREIGVRIALGATSGDVIGLVLATGLRPIAAGIGAGLLLAVPAAIALSRLFRYTPVPLRAADPMPYAVVVIALVGVTLGTMLVPARRASAVPPSIALRTE